MQALILVDENDTEIGSEEKMAAHQNGGKLHRAFSVFVYNDAGQMLLQRRADGKYHFGGLWTNTCCGHPLQGEQVADAARRRTNEELGIDVPLRRAGTFVYRAEDPQSGLVEHEFDHMFVGESNGPLNVDPQEVAETRWVDPGEVREWLDREPAAFTPWFPIALENLEI
jgi:isopentenyl-diphosphate delta-isomerase